jgi:hypothetical protein
MLKMLRESASSGEGSVVSMKERRETTKKSGRKAYEPNGKMSEPNSFKVAQFGRRDGVLL